MLTAVDGRESPHYRVWILLATLIVLTASLGLAGCAGIVSGSNGTNTTQPPPTLAISNVQAGSPTTSSFQINWTTNIAATSAVDYGTSSSYGASTTLNAS